MLLPGVSRDMAAMAARLRTTIPRVPLGPHQSIRLQHIRADGGGGGRGGSAEDLLANRAEQCAAVSRPVGRRAALTATLTLMLLLLQDLKEKKLAEEKENGKDAATNGKVGAQNFWPKTCKGMKTLADSCSSFRRMRRTVSLR